MCSVAPSERVTVPLPDHTPAKPANGPDWATPADTDNMSAVPTLAALIACPRNLELSFISSFPIQMTCSSRDTSRRIKDLVSPQYVRFKRQRPRCLHGAEPAVAAGPDKAQTTQT